MHTFGNAGVQLIFIWKRKVQIDGKIPVSPFPEIIDTGQDVVL